MGPPNDRRLCQVAGPCASVVRWAPCKQVSFGAGHVARAPADGSAAEIVSWRRPVLWKIRQEVGHRLAAQQDNLVFGAGPMIRWLPPSVLYGQLVPWIEKRGGARGASSSAPLRRCGDSGSSAGSHVVAILADRYSPVSALSAGLSLLFRAAAPLDRSLRSAFGWPTLAPASASRRQLQLRHACGAQNHVFFCSRILARRTYIV